MTTDVDAIIQAASSMKDAANKVGDRNGLPNGWLNTDFMKTESYTPKLVEYSVYYKKFYGVLEARTITAEYLIAMERIETAVRNLYGDWASLPENSRQFIKNAMGNGNFAELYAEVMESERETKSELIEFVGKYPKAANESNINEVIASLKRRKCVKEEER